MNDNLSNENVDTRRNENNNGDELFTERTFNYPIINSRETHYSKYQIRNAFKGIIRVNRNENVICYLYDGARIENLRLIDIYPSRHPVFAKFLNLINNAIIVLRIEAIAQITVFTNKVVPENRFYRNSRYTNAIREVLRPGDVTDLIIAGNNTIPCNIIGVYNGIIISTSRCPGSINYTATAAIIGYTVSPPYPPRPPFQPFPMKDER